MIVDRHQEMGQFWKAFMYFWLHDIDYATMGLQVIVTWDYLELPIITKIKLLISEFLCFEQLPLIFRISLLSGHHLAVVFVNQ